MARDLDERIERLPEDEREEFDRRLEVFGEELSEELLEQHRKDIKNRIKSDEDELSDFNVVVSAFLEQDETGYDYIRTEPMCHDQDKNFDILVANPSKGIAVLVEIERTLLDRLPGKLSKFKGKVNVVRSNEAEFDVKDYFEDVLSTTPEEYDYVLASQFLDAADLKETARGMEDFDLDFVAWMLASHGNLCRVKDYIIKREKTGAFDGHRDDDLTEYIRSQLESGVEKQDYVSFTFTSSKYLKLKHMSIALVNRFQRKSGDGSFTYSGWKQLFEKDIDLYNYLEDEKRTLFKRYINYGQEVGVITIEDDNGDRFENEYRVVSRATKNQEKLVDELMEKMAKARMEDDYNKAMREKKEELVTELRKKHATGGTTLYDFEGFEPSAEDTTDE